MENNYQGDQQLPETLDDTADGIAQQHKYESAAELPRHDANECCWESSRQAILAASVLLAVTGTFFTQSGRLDYLAVWVRLVVLLSWIFHLTSMALGCLLFLSEERFFTKWTEFYDGIAAKYSDSAILVAQTSEEARVEARKLPRSSPRALQIWQVGLFLLGGLLDLVVFGALIF